MCGSIPIVPGIIIGVPVSSLLLSAGAAMIKVVCCPISKTWAPLFQALAPARSRPALGRTIFCIDLIVFPRCKIHTGPGRAPHEGLAMIDQICAASQPHMQRCAHPRRPSAVFLLCDPVPDSKRV